MILKNQNCILYLGCAQSYQHDHDDGLREYAYPSYEDGKPCGTPAGYTR